MIPHAYYGSCLYANGENCRAVGLYLTLKRHYCIITIILMASLPHPGFVSQSLSLFLPLFPYQGNSVVSRATEVEEEFPFVFARISLGSWKDVVQWGGSKEG